MSYVNSSAGSAQSGVRYSIRSNKAVSATKGKTAYTVTVDAPAISLDTLATRMVKQGSAYNTRDIVAVFDEMTEVIIECLNEGSAVNLGSIVRLRPTIKGTLDSESASLSATENPVTVAVSAGSRIRDMVRDATTIRIGVDDLVPSITAVRDNATNQSTVITSQGNFIVSGTNLSWDTTASDEGFFLVVNGEETKATLLDDDISAMILLKNEATFTTAGDAITLIFRKKTTDGTLKQYTYAGTLATALAE